LLKHTIRLKQDFTVAGQINKSGSAYEACYKSLNPSQA